MLYINDIVHVVNRCNIRLFADDTYLHIEVGDSEETAKLVNNDLTAISAWSQKWLVNFSPSKTKSHTTRNKHDAQLNPQVSVSGLCLKANINDVHVALKARKKLNLMIPLTSTNILDRCGILCCV